MTSRRSKKGTKKGAQKKSGVNRKSGYGPSTSLGVGGTPAKVRVVLKYFQSTAYAPGAGVTSTNAFRGNGPYDPDASGTGSQPVNFDDWAILYNRYRVISSKIEWNFQPASNADFLAVCYPSNSLSGLAAASSICQPRAKWRAGWSSLGFVDGKSGFAITQHATTKAILGEDFGDRFESLVTTTPADPWYWNVQVASIGSSTPSGIVNVLISYDVEFMDRNSETLDLEERKLAVDIKRLARLKAEAKLVVPVNGNKQELKLEKKAQFPPEVTSLTSEGGSGDYVVIKRSSLKGARVHARSLAAGATRAEDPD